MNLFILCRKIHRFFVAPVVLLAIVMITTGTFLKYSNSILARQIHNFLSPYFSMVLLVMMITGLYLYLFPYFRRNVSPKP